LTTTATTTTIQEPSFSSVDSQKVYEVYGGTRCTVGQASDINTKPLESLKSIRMRQVVSWRNISYFGTFNECFVHTWDTERQRDRYRTRNRYRYRDSDTIVSAASQIAASLSSSILWLLFYIRRFSTWWATLESKSGQKQRQRQRQDDRLLSVCLTILLIFCLFVCRLVSFAITIIFYLPKLTQETTQGTTTGYKVSLLCLSL